jgi:hypothetical protein
MAAGVRLKTHPEPVHQKPFDLYFLALLFLGAPILSPNQEDLEIK